MIDPAPPPMALDARHPLRLDRPGLAMIVATGIVDIFAQRYSGDRADGPRTHLFRVETGDLLLGLAPSKAHPDESQIGILAVGGPGSTVTEIGHARLPEAALIEAWLLRLSAAIACDGTMTVRAEAGTTVGLLPSQRLIAPSHGVAWATVESGRIRIMASSAIWTTDDGPLPLAAGVWIEAAEASSLVLTGSEALSEEKLWRALDRFHGTAVTILEQRFAEATGVDALRLQRHSAEAVVQTDRMLRDLAQTILSHGEEPAAEPELEEPLVAVCRLIAHALGGEIERRPCRSANSKPGDVEAIMRSAHLRVRRILLRPGWWRRNSGPLIAWLGEAEQPVALLPASSRRYLMVEAGSETGRPVDEELATSLSAIALTFYRPFPDGRLSAMRLLRWSADVARGDLTRLLLGGGAMALLTLAGPVITAVIVDAVIPRADLGQLTFCAVALLASAIGVAGFQAVQGIATLRLSGELDRLLQAAVIDRLLRLPIAFFARYVAGDLADRVLGIEDIRQVLTGRAVGGLLAGIFSVLSIGLMFCFAPRLAATALVLAAIDGAVIGAVSARRLSHERSHFDLQGKSFGLVLQFLTGIGKLRVAEATTRALAIWTEVFSRQKRHFIASRLAANSLAAFEAGFPTLASLILFADALHGGAGSDSPDPGRFLAFFAAFGQSLAAISSLADAIGETLVAVPFFNRLQPVLDAPLETADAREAPGELSGSVELSQVSFQYLETGAPILDGFSIRIASGEYVALVGPSGSGKSTIFRLLLGFERAQSGTILFDGRPVDALDISALRRQIGVVLQNGKLTSGNIYENICGAVLVPVEQAWEAARDAGLDADIEAMPMGMYTVITEGMNALSGGQRQRLMIARALIHRPRMLLFDEATSALDNRTQAIVSASLARLNVTRIVIAHRLSTVQDADRIIVLSAGRVVQAGTFSELSNSPGLFAELAGRQLV